MAANIKPLKMCINITIPSVEDTDLSLYEAMCTLAGKLQDTISEINEILADVVVTVNGKQGPEVVLNGDDISVSSTDNQSISGVLSQKYSADNPPPYPVVMVNGKQGNVTLSAGDINASTGKTVEQTLQENTVDITSLEADLPMKYGEDNPPPYPVTSVNSRTGNVRLTAESIDTTEAGTSIQDELNALNAGLLQTFRTSNTVYTTWNSVKNLAPGAYKTNGFLPWMSTISASGCLIIMQSGNGAKSYIFTRDDVIDTLFWGVNNPTSADNWFLIQGSPISG